jgi:hypothetical protein
LKTRRKYSTYASRSFGARRVRTLHTRSLGVPTRRSPVVESIDASESTRSGRRIAIVWAIIPPIEVPTRWARSMPRWSRRPNVSFAMSSSRYGTFVGRPETSRMMFGIGPLILVDRPASRLSKRITWKPRSANNSHSSRSQWISCIPRPITSSSAGSEGSPIVS